MVFTTGGRMGTPLMVMLEVNLLSRQREWFTSTLSKEWFLVSKYSNRSPIIGGKAAWKMEDT